MSSTKALVLALAILGLCVGGAYAGRPAPDGELQEIKTILLNSQRIQFMTSHPLLFKNHQVGKICDFGPGFPERCEKLEAMSLLSEMIRSRLKGLEALEFDLKREKEKAKDTESEERLKRFYQEDETTRNSGLKYRTPEERIQDLEMRIQGAKEEIEEERQRIESLKREVEAEMKKK